MPDSLWDDGGSDRRGTTARRDRLRLECSLGGRPNLSTGEAVSVEYAVFLTIFGRSYELKVEC